MKRSFIAIGAFGIAFILELILSSKTLAQFGYEVSIYTDFSYGVVNVDGVNYTDPHFNWHYGEHHTLLFERQFVGGYWHVFNRWYDVIHGSPSYDNPVTIRITGITQFEADTYKQYSVQFQNNFVGIGNGGIIYVNGTQYNSPTSEFFVRQIDSINASAESQDFNYIHYTFDHWSDGSTSISKYFKPTTNTTYTANFAVKPIQVTVTSAGGQNYQPVVLTWQVHSNPDVTYDIYLKKRSNGVMGNPTLEASSLPHSTTSYTSPVYINTPNGTDLLYWDVRAYHPPTSTSADQFWTCSGYGTAQPKTTANDATKANIAEEIEEFAVSNFPNPFNPSTTILFDLPEASFVRLRVFNLLGRTVATLVEQQVAAGRHAVTFDASNLPSGVYLYRIEAGKYTETKKLLLIR
jgi:hypothetical protein